MTAVLFDFSDPRSVALWNPIDDGVMGGVSRSRFRHDPAGHAVFAGHVSFENNGGFASVRCQPCDLGRKEVVAYLLEVRGDGKRYKLNLRTDNGFDGVNYQARLEAPAAIWTTCRLASADFLPSWRGRPVPDAAPLDTARLRQIGLMIADRQEGPFALAVRSIAVEIA
jgi:NADH dehydrogenase [ubiquinone] 1 alpha subcomplex assembly factor 1